MASVLNPGAFRHAASVHLAGTEQGSTDDVLEHFTPLSSLLGGLLIGLASAMVLLFNGRIAGISGIAGGILRWRPGEISWRAAFLAGLVLGAFAWFQVAPGAFEVSIQRSALALGAGGFLVGVGTQIGGGCTSGHGICGIGRLSRRSIVAVLVFMAAAAATVALTGALAGGVI